MWSHCIYIISWWLCPHILNRRRIKSNPTCKIFEIGNGFWKGHQHDHGNAAITMKRTASTPCLCTQICRCLSVICSIQSLSSCQESHAFQLHNQYYHYVLFLATEYISSNVILPKPTLVWRAETLLSTPLSFAAVPICLGHCLLSPRCRGISRHSPLVLPIFLSKWLSNRSFVWEASCWHPEYMSQICPAPPSDPSAEELPVSNLLMGDSPCVQHPELFSNGLFLSAFNFLTSTLLGFQLLS